MSIPLRQRWTQEEFFAWAQDQEIRYEFDGFEPVAMTGGFANASAIGVNLIYALKQRLNGTEYRPLGFNAGIETINKAVRYPDALVTCTTFPGNARTLPGVVAVFEVVGNTRDAMRRDHFEKVKEYAAVPSIRRYVIIESSLPAVTVLSRNDADDPWTHTGLNGDDILQIPEIGIESPSPTCMMTSVSTTRKPSRHNRPPATRPPHPVMPANAGIHDFLPSGPPKTRTTRPPPPASPPRPPYPTSTSP